MEKELVCGKPKLKIGLPFHHCPGCHYGIIFRIICEVIDELDIEGRTILLVGGGCTSRWARYFDLDTFGGPHGPGLAIASGIKRVRPDAIIIVVQGDGEQGAIGIGSFFSAVLRAEKLTCIGLNNACFGTTGGQMAPTSLVGMKTTTTPDGRDPDNLGFPFHAPEMAAMAKGTAYAARVSVHNPAERQRAKQALKTAVQKQIDRVGFSLVEFLGACPSNWHLDPLQCLSFIDEKMMKEFPLGEFKNVDSIDYTIA